MSQDLSVTATLWVENHIGDASMNRLKAALRKFIAAQALPLELHLPPTAFGHSPSEVVLKGYGYGEWGWTRPGVVGPTVAELKTALDNKSNVALQEAIYVALAKFLPPNVAAKFWLRQTGGRLEYVLSWGDGCEVVGERIRGNLYVTGTGNRGIGHNDIKTTVVRVVLALPVADDAEGASQAHAQGFGKGRTLHLAGYWFDKDTQVTSKWEAEIPYSGAGHSNMVMLHPSLGVDGEFTSECGKGIGFGVKHKGLAVGEGAVTCMVLLINVGLKGKGVTIDSCFEHARLRAPQLEWTTTLTKPVVVSDMFPQLANLGIVDRVRVLRSAKEKLEALRASQQLDLPNTRFGDMGMHNLHGTSHKSLFGGNDDGLLIKTETSDSEDHSDVEMSSPQETHTTSPSSPTFFGLASNVLPTVLTTALVATALAVSGGPSPTSSTTCTSPSKNKREKSKSVEGSEGYSQSGPELTRTKHEQG